MADATERGRGDLNVVPSDQVLFDAKKFRNLMLHVAERSAEDPKFGATKLNKILYFSDFLAYARLGKPITGATYQRLRQGPAPRQLLPERGALFREGKARIEARRRFNLPQKRLIALEEADLTLFSAEELEIVDEVIDGLLSYGAMEVSELSHELAIGWQLVEDGEDIPYYTAYLTGEPPSEADIEWAQGLAKEHGWEATG